MKNFSLMKAHIDKPKIGESVRKMTIYNKEKPLYRYWLKEKRLDNGWRMC